MRSKIALVIDSIGISTVLSFIVYAWISFLSKNLTLSIIACLSVLVLMLIACFYIHKLRQKKLNITKEKQQNVDKIRNKLQFCPQKQQTLWIKQSIYPTTTRVFDDFFVHNQHCVYNLLSTPQVSVEDLCRLLREVLSTINFSEFQKITILAESFLDSTKNFAKNLNIQVELLDIYQATQNYNLTYNTIPECIKIVKQPKNYQYFVKYILSPERFKSYLTLGLILLVSSFFVMFKVYYLIFGSLLLAMSIVTLFIKAKAKSLP